MGHQHNYWKKRQPEHNPLDVMDKRVFQFDVTLWKKYPHKELYVDHMTINGVLFLHTKGKMTKFIIVNKRYSKGK